MLYSYGLAVATAIKRNINIKSDYAIIDKNVVN